jgi:hypothetical protein
MIGGKTMMDPELVEYLDRRFEYLDQRFEYLDQRFEYLDQRFEAIDRRFGEADERIDQRFRDQDQRIDQRFREAVALTEDLRVKIETVAAGVVQVGEDLREFRREMERQLEEVKAVNALSYREIDRRLRSLEAVDAGPTAD